MPLKPVLILAALLLCAELPLMAQTAPAAVSGGNQHLEAGAGLSDFDVDWGHGRMLGGTLWVDWSYNQVPSFLRGVGIEAEWRDISLNRSSTQPPNYRLDTIGGGVIYTLRRYGNFEPYGKFLLDYGGIDWNNPEPEFDHETRTVFAPGLGLKYLIHGNILVRVDYEYQFWPNIAPMSSGTHILDPQGFTIGVMYDLTGLYRHSN
jgi:opacity protein-like surface antigen